MRGTSWSVAARLAFVGAALLVGLLALRGRWDEVGDAVAAIPPWGPPASLVLVMLGLLCTGFVWLRIMSAHGTSLPTGQGLAIFFLGQLGKYLPGSVWSIGAQATLARRFDAPVRRTASVGLIFLGVHVATAGLIAATAGLAGWTDDLLPVWLSWLAIVAIPLSLSPWALNRIAGRTAGSGSSPRLSVADAGIVLGLMAVAWVAYGLALVVLLDDPDAGRLGTVVGAFALAYAVGVVIVFAPAGVGAREAVFVVAAAPSLGVGPAAALAVTARVVHTLADFTMAGVAHVASTRAAGP